MHASSVGSGALHPVVLAYHGCSAAVGRKVLLGQEFLKPSRNSNDWLGDGLYFWENDYGRALQWAIEKRFKEPFVLGAYISLGHCLGLTDQEGLELLPKAHKLLAETTKQAGQPMPVNTRHDSGGVPRKRELDCAVINSLHMHLKQENARPFDTVRIAFQEGNPLYPGASFHDKNHVQICVREPQCILGFFHVLAPNDYPKWGL